MIAAGRCDLFGLVDAVGRDLVIGKIAGFGLGYEIGRGVHNSGDIAILQRGDCRIVLILIDGNLRR